MKRIILHLHPQPLPGWVGFDSPLAAAASWPVRQGPCFPPCTCTCTRCLAGLLAWVGNNSTVGAACRCPAGMRVPCWLASALLALAAGWPTFRCFASRLLPTFPPAPLPLKARVRSRAEAKILLACGAGKGRRKGGGVERQTDRGGWWKGRPACPPSPRAVLDGGDHLATAQPLHHVSKYQNSATKGSMLIPQNILHGVF